jgi:hypothetical protein
VQIHFVVRLVLASTAIGASLMAQSQGPCDIYAGGGTPCVAAHSTTRALYAAYSGPLYQVQRASDNTTLDIKPLKAGGVANAGSQDTFCADTVCFITAIYDQSGKGNHLTQAGIFTPYPNRGTRPGGGDNLAIANKAPVTVSGRRAYGVYTIPGMGYRKTNAVGTATGRQAEGIYAVMDGTHYNDGCCFDYGNAEQFAGNEQIFVGEMETIYFGSNTSWGRGAGSGPWIKADLELGVYAGGVSIPTPVLSSPSLTWRFLTAMVDGHSENRWDIRGGNAQSGQLASFWDGVRPPAYDGSCGRSDKKPPCEYYPMQLEGGIVLGTGGMNDSGGTGTFYEGAMTIGYPSEATAQAVQANIVAARYNLPELTLTTVQTFTPGSSQTVTAAFTNYTGQPVSGVSLNLTAPKGWTVAKDASAGGGPVAPGQSVATTFTVAAPLATGAGSLIAAAAWTNADASKGSATAGDSVRSAHAVKINEVRMGANSFIELYNAGAAPVDISGWSLTYTASGLAEEKIATIRAGAKIASHGYYLLGGAGYAGPPSAHQPYTTTIATMGSLALKDATGALVVDSVDWTNNVATGVVISPLLAEGGCPALMPGGRGGAGGGGGGAQAGRGGGIGATAAAGPGGAQTAPQFTNLSIFRWPDGADTDSNCADFRVQAATTMPAASAVGATALKVAALANFSAGQPITIDTGSNAETAVIASMGSPGATTASAAVQAGATVIPVASAAGFLGSQMITIDVGANQETLVVVAATGTGRGQGPPTITVATPLKMGHSAGTQVSGTGILLTAPLTKAHAAGAQVTGDLPTPGAANRYNREQAGPGR